MIYGWPVRLAGLVPASLIVSCLAVPPDGDDPSHAVAALGSATTLQEPVSPAPAATIDWSQGDCLSQLQTLQQAAEQGRLTPDDQPPFAAQLVSASRDWLDAVPELPIDADLPITVHDGAPTGARCVIRIGPARDQTAAHRAVDVQDVRSAYQSTSRSERNPDYDAAQLALRQAKEGAKGQQKVVRVDDPLLDLIGTTVGGLIGSFDRRIHQQEADEAAAQLAATPRSRDRPVYRPYSFERIVVRGQKQAVVPVTLLDGAGRLLRQAELRQSERREFFVVRGLDPRDRDYEQHRSSSMSRADLARWARTPPALRLSSVAIALTEAPSTGPADVVIAPAASGTLPKPAVAPLPDDMVLPDPFAALDASLEDWDDPAGMAVALAVPGPEPYESLGFDLEGLAPARASDLLAEPGATLDPGDDPSAASVVAIRAGHGAGNGFYVRSDLVLTSHRLVGTTSVVDVTTADGATVPALVAGVDPVRDLALLQVPRPGPALVLAESGSPRPGYRAGGDDPPGRPVVADGQVVGMTTGVAGGHGGEVVPIAAIRAFLASQAAVFAAVP